ncbi:MAG: AAA family ATPase [Candidatus Competibacteraceae bacterium]|nr:AAA family ATPase [Candidatus Competibacteraceae bacterium]MBK8752599.1 AAA family ATPase [Candidatus Competibacteraceae bacterium]
MDKVITLHTPRHAGIDLDLAASCGIELPPNTLAAAVKAGISNPIKPLGKASEPDHGFQWASDFCQQPTESNHLIRGVLDLESTSFIFGPSGDGKTFVALDRDLHVAHRMRWLGKKTKKGIVLYIAGEGKAGLAKRVKAWHEYHGLNPSDALIAFRTVPTALCDPKAVIQLIDHIQQFIEGMDEKPVLIELDTLAKNFGAGYDENAAKDMAAFVAGMDALKRATGAAISAIHHPGHGNKDRGAGSKNLPAGVDFSFKVEKSGKSVDDFITTMSFEKVKDGENPKPVAWTWKRQPLPWVEQDDDDCWVPVSSIVLVPTQAVASTRSTKLTLPQRIALDVLTRLTGTEDHALIADWRNAAFEAGIGFIPTKVRNPPQSRLFSLNWEVVPKTSKWFEVLVDFRNEV